MKFNVSSQTLCSRLQTISRVQSSKNALPILDSILFELNENELRLTASDSETTIVTTLEVSETEGFGKVAIGSKQLINSVKEISDQPITFDINESTYQIEICYQNGKYNLVAQNGDEFPVPSSSDYGMNSAVFPSSVLLNGISRSVFATADDELRPQMNGVYFDLSPEYATLVASDGHKLVRNRVLSVHVAEPYSFILPKKPSLLLKSILSKEQDDAEIRFDERNAEIILANYKMSCRLIEGRYPNYNSVIPKDNPFRVTIDRLSFIAALRRVSVFASESSSLIKLQLTDNTLLVSTQDIDFSKSAEESVVCDYAGMPMSIGFNGPFLLDVLNSISSQEVILELADPSRAGVIVPADQEEDEEVIMLLMPMMLQD